MIVQFMLKNVLSFKDETILDMTAINSYKEHMGNLIDIDYKEKYLKVSAIYGANASGKSNLYFAMKFFQEIVARSLDSANANGLTVIEECYAPFQFEKDPENSEFQIIEIVDNFEYRYGFEYNAREIVSEWLYRINLNTNRTSTILERSTDEIVFGASVRKDCNVYKNQIPSETLALSFFNRLKINTDVFETVFAGIMDTLVLPSSLVEEKRLLQRMLPDIIDGNKDSLLQFLKAVDTGVRDIAYDDTDDDIDFLTYHQGEDGEMYSLNLYSESEGTIKSIVLFIFIGIAIKNDKSIFVDELNIKLHPLLLKFIIDLFYDSDSKAQLIYTTHDTTLLDKKFFRRDQIWFVEKNEYGYSKLTALSDYKVRSDASFEKDYLAGVYGGIPLLKEFSMKGNV